MEKTNEEKSDKTKRKRIEFPLPRADVTLTTELNILKAFVEDYRKKGQPLKYDEVTSTSINKYVVSSELKFFASIGLADKQKRSKYIPTPDAIKIADYMMQERVEDSKKILRKILVQSWFGEKVTSVLKIEKEKKIDDLIKLLVKDIRDLNVKELSKKAKKTMYRLIEWLEYAEIIEIDENKIVKLKKIPALNNNEDNEDEGKEGATLTSKIEEVTSEPIVEEKTVQSGENKKMRKEILLNLTINIQIDSNTDVEKVREIMKVIQQYLVGDDDE